MLKWDMLNRHISMSSLDIKPGDEVNVFINFESVLKNLTSIRGLKTKLSTHRQDIVIELESAILNLVGHYKSYFRKDKCDVRIYLYHTSLDENDQQMRVYNKYYRTSYRNRYMQNPQLRDMGDALQKIIIPEIKLIITYIDKCYFIESKSFDSSIIPMIIANGSSAKNVIITMDVFDTLYLFNSNFMPIYIDRKYQELNVASTIPEMLPLLISPDVPYNPDNFNSEMFYRLLLAVKGSKIRNIGPIRGYTTTFLSQTLTNSLTSGSLLTDFQSIDSVLTAFPSAMRNQLRSSLQCLNLDNHYDLLSEVDVSETKSQIVDKVDMKSVEALNNQRFLEYPINLPNLIN